MSEIDSLYTVRPYVTTDKPFVKSTFLRGLYYGSSWFNLIPKDIFMQNYRYIADAIIDNPKTTISIACLKEDPDVILGYAMHGSAKTMHFCFVKRAWRQQGIARKLIPATVDTVSHVTDLGKILMPKIPNCVFNPFDLR